MSLAEHKCDDQQVYVWTAGSATYHYGYSWSASGTAATYRGSTRTTDEFSAYEDYDFPDWDGSNAAPITLETVNAARRLRNLLPRSVPSPDIAPGGDGTIGFEWRSGQEITFIEVGPGKTVKASRFFPNRPPETWPQKLIPFGIHSLLHTLFPANERA
jgi:hypothetical protein